MLVQLNYFNTHSTVLQNIWRVENEHSTFYLSMNNDGEIRALTGEPNPDFGPSKNDQLINGVIHIKLTYCVHFQMCLEYSVVAEEDDTSSTSTLWYQTMVVDTH